MRSRFQRTAMRCPAHIHSALTEQPPPAYRVFLLAKTGGVIGMVPFAVQDDSEAVERAKAMVDGHDIELWDGSRFIEHFPPAD
ncbi:hypothetical protein [Methylobacterium sp. CM6247]